MDSENAAYAGSTEVVNIKQYVARVLFTYSLYDVFFPVSCHTALTKQGLANGKIEVCEILAKNRFRRCPRRFKTA
jgi:hypothetical protein